MPGRVLVHNKKAGQQRHDLPLRTHRLRVRQRDHRAGTSAVAQRICWRRAELAHEYSIRKPRNPTCSGLIRTIAAIGPPRIVVVTASRIDFKNRPCGGAAALIIS